MFTPITLFLPSPLSPFFSTVSSPFMSFFFNDPPEHTGGCSLERGCGGIYMRIGYQ